MKKYDSHLYSTEHIDRAPCFNRYLFITMFGLIAKYVKLEAKSDKMNQRSQYFVCSPLAAIQAEIRWGLENVLCIFNEKKLFFTSRKIQNLS